MLHNPCFFFSPECFWFHNVVFFLFKLKLFCKHLFFKSLMSVDRIIHLVIWLCAGQTLNCGVISGTLWRILSSPRCPNRFFIPPSLPFCVYWGQVKWPGHQAEYSHQVLGLRMGKTIPPYPSAFIVCQGHLYLYLTHFNQICIFLKDFRKNPQCQFLRNCI